MDKSACDRQGRGRAPRRAVRCCRAMDCVASLAMTKWAFLPRQINPSRLGKNSAFSRVDVRFGS